MNKKAFTMIELVFVIVILGILAAVAVPKLTATRVDAQTALAQGQLKQLVNDIKTYRTINDDWPATWYELTNVRLVDSSKVDIGNSPIGTGNTVQAFLSINSVPCLSISVNNITSIALGRTQISASVCDPFIQYAKDNNYLASSGPTPGFKTYTFGNTGITP